MSDREKLYEKARKEADAYAAIISAASDKDAVLDLVRKAFLAGWDARDREAKR